MSIGINMYTVGSLRSYHPCLLFRTFDLSIFFISFRKFYTSLVQKTAATTSPVDQTVRGVSSEGDHDESANLPVDDRDDYEYQFDDSEEENRDAIESETEEVVVEDKDGVIGAAAAWFSWAHNGITWT